MIRRAIEGDPQNIVAITQACAHHMIAEGIFQWNEHYPSLSTFERDLVNQELYVLEVDKAVIGAIVISTRMDDFYQAIEWLTPSTKNGYLHRLCVHPEFQGKGYAKQLLDFAEDKLRNQGCLSVRLDTFSKNVKNQKLYEARGYQKLGDVYFEQKSEHPFHCYELVF